MMYSYKEKYNIYVVHAYRWGNMNEHNYLVGAWPNKETANREAKQVCDDRGGKYGVIVTEVDGYGNITCETQYYSSTIGEDDLYKEHPYRYISDKLAYWQFAIAMYFKHLLNKMK